MTKVATLVAAQAPRALQLPVLFFPIGGITTMESAYAALLETGE